MGIVSYAFCAIGIAYMECGKEALMLAHIVEWIMNVIIFWDWNIDYSQLPGRSKQRKKAAH